MVHGVSLRADICHVFTVHHYRDNTGLHVHHCLFLVDDMHDIHCVLGHYTLVSSCAIVFQHAACSHVV